MYVGRMVGVGKTKEGKNTAIYRVSSRSFPNRTAIIAESGDSVAIESRDPEEEVTNPFVKYTCVQKSSDWLVMSNGTHTDLIAQRLEEGLAPAEALATTLEEFGYEQDGHNTPRIAGIVPREGNKGWLGVIRDDGLELEEVDLENGQFRYVATNEHSSPRPDQVVSINETDPTRIAQALIESAEGMRFVHPVTSVAGVAMEHSFELETYDYTGQKP